MGKNGKLLREQKKMNTARMYTVAEIEAIKRQAVEEDRAAMEKLRRYQQTMDRKAVNQLLETEWKAREQAFRGEDEDESFQKVMSLTMHIPVTVLCETFHWKPIDDSSDGRNHLQKFVDALVAEVDRICSDENMDIRKYADQCSEKYGVKFEVK
jgi:hypothetical protein